VQLVKMPEVGVPKAGVTKVGEVKVATVSVTLGNVSVKLDAVLAFAKATCPPNAA
jgi:hypothetical protein